MKLRHFGAFLAALWGFGAVPAYADRSDLPTFVAESECVAIVAEHHSNRNGVSVDGRGIEWGEIVPANEVERSFPYQIHLCLKPRGTMLLGQAWFFTSKGWVGPLDGRVRDFMSRRGLAADCARFQYRSPIGGFMRIHELFKSDVLCGTATNTFEVTHQRITDEGSQREGRPIGVQLKIFSARLEPRDGPPRN